DLVRFGAQAHAVVAVGDDAVRHAELVGPRADADVAYVYPYGDVAAAAAAAGWRPIEGADPAPVRRLWRLGLAAELSGAMLGAVEAVAAYLTARRQFGRPLAALQALQHRMAEAHASAEAARWSTRYAAWHADDDEAVA